MVSAAWDFGDPAMPALLRERMYDWRGNPLKVESPFELSKTQVEVSSFVRASVAYHAEQRRQREEKAAADRSRRQRLIKGAAAGLTIIAVLSATAAAIGFNLQMQATARELASKALLAMHNPAVSAHIAVAALEKDPSNRMGMRALRDSLATLEIAHTERILNHSGSVSDARFTSDGKFIVVAGGNEVRIYDSASYEQKGAPFKREGVLEAWLILDNNVLLTRTKNGQAQLESIGSPRKLRAVACDGQGDSVFTVRPSPDGRYVAAGCAHGRILVWDVKESNDAPKYTFTQKSGSSITTLAFDPDSIFIAAGDADGNVYVWKLCNSEAWIKKGEIRHKEAVRELNFHPQRANLLVTASDDGKAVVWSLDLEKRRVDRIDKDTLRVWKLLHRRPVTSAKFAIRKEGTDPVVTVSGTTSHVWVNEQLEERQTRGHNDWVTETNTSRDGEYLVTASADGTARIWSTRTAGTIAILRGHRGEVTRASFSPTDRSLAITAGDDRTVRIWRLKIPETLWSFDGWVLSARFEPDGKRIAATGENGKAVVLKIGEPRQSTVQHVEPEALEAESALAGNLSRVSWSHDRKYLADRRRRVW
jgi:WD40 repeat protein